MSRDPRPSTRAVNVLVMVGAVMVLLCLLLPAIPHFRRGPQRIHCKNNLRQLGIAVYSFHTSKQRLPGYVVDFGTFNPTKTPDDPWNSDADASTLIKHRKVGPLHVALLAFIDQQTLYEVWSNNKYPIVANDPNSTDSAGFRMIAAPNVSTFQCPLNAGRAWTNNSYVCNTGLASSALNKADRALFRNSQFAGLDAKGSPIKLAPTTTFDEITDGLTDTVLFSESLQAMPWHRAGFIDANDLALGDDEEQVRFEPTARFTQGMVWHAESDDASLGLPAVKAVHRINGTINGQTLDRLRMTRETAADLARPSSLHTAGVNMVFADGSVRMISATIDYRVYQSMLSPDDQASPPPLGPSKN